MITEERLKEMLFTAEVMAVARTVADLDDREIERLIQENNDREAVLNPGSFEPHIMKRVVATMAIMSFMIKQLKQVLPSIEEVKESNKRILDVLPKEMADKVLEIERIIKNEPRNGPSGA